MTPVDLDALDALEREATAGPVSIPDAEMFTQRRAILDDRGGEICDAPYERLRDLRLYVALRNAYPALAAEIRRLREENERLQFLITEELGYCLLCRHPLNENDGHHPGCAHYPILAAATGAK